MKRLIIATAICAALTTNALAVSVGEIAGKCGDDGKAYCAGVGYGDAMQACLDKNYTKLSAPCKAIMDRLRKGEGVSLF